MANEVALFPVSPELTTVSVAYRNRAFIADDVLPRVPVGVQNFKYKKFDAADSFTIPNTEVGRTGVPGELQFGYTEEDSSAQGYALDELVPKADIDNAPAGYKPLERAALSLTNLILLDRERRAADLVFNAANYAAANKTTLTGTAQFSNDASDPIKTILDALDVCIMRPNKMVLGQAVWTALRRHPRIVKATQGNAGDAGVAVRQAVAELFELEAIYVGGGLYNSENKGKAMVMTPLWGKHIALIYHDALPDTMGNSTFGFTAQWGEREVRLIDEPKRGLGGSTLVRVGEWVRELITADNLGYFIQNAVA